MQTSHLSYELFNHYAYPYEIIDWDKPAVIAFYLNLFNEYRENYDNRMACKKLYITYAGLGIKSIKDYKAGQKTVTG